MRGIWLFANLHPFLSSLNVLWNVSFYYNVYNTKNYCRLTGSLIKLVYFSRHEDQSIDDKRKKTINERLGISNGNRRSYPILGGRLHFVKFETTKINECLDFIHSKQLHRGGIHVSLLSLSLSPSFLFSFFLLIAGHSRF